MSSYPPPPPPGGQYPPPYDRNAWKAQRRAMKIQARMQRQQMRAQMRQMRRGSIVGPLVLLTLGVLFLLAQTGRISWGHVFGWYGSWWPLVLIGAGVVLLAEWALDQRPDPNGIVRGRRTLGGGVIALLIFLVFVGLCSRVSDDVFAHGAQMHEHFFGKNFDGFDHLIGDQHEVDSSLSGAMPTGAMLIVRNARGNISVTGSSDDGQVHVSAHKLAWAWQESEAEDKERRLEPTLSSDGSSVSLTAPSVEGGQDDLTIEMPRGSALTLQADRGDISVNEVSAPVTLSANHGDVNLSAIAGTVTAHMNDDDASVSGHSLTGPVLIEGRTGDVNLSDVNGGVTLQGDFFGTTHLEHVNGVVRFQSSRTQFEAARLDGSFEVETGTDLQADQLLGPVVLTTKNRNITLERVQGSVRVTNRNGSVSVTSAAPLAPIQINNQHGSVDLGLPGSVGFVLAASTKHGEMENDFNLQSSSGEGQQTLQGTVAGGGPSVSVQTTDGDVTVRKSVVAPLPPTPPAPPRITVTPPAAPGAPKVPQLPKMPKVPAAPKAPAAPTPPAGTTF